MAIFQVTNFSPTHLMRLLLGFHDFHLDHYTVPVAPPSRFSSIAPDTKETLRSLAVGVSSQPSPLKDCVCGCEASL